MTQTTLGLEANEAAERATEADPMRATFGLLVRRARMRAGMTAKEAAKAAVMSQPYWLDIENGQRNPPNEPVVRKMAAALVLDPVSTEHWVLTAGWAHVPECWRREFRRVKRFLDRQDEMRQERDERTADHSG